MVTTQPQDQTLVDPEGPLCGYDLSALDGTFPAGMNNIDVETMAAQGVLRTHSPSVLLFSIVH